MDPFSELTPNVTDQYHPRSPVSADQKAASCGLFLLLPAHPAVRRGWISTVASRHQ